MQVEYNALSGPEKQIIDVLLQDENFVNSNLDIETLPNDRNNIEDKINEINRNSESYKGGYKFH